MMYEKIKNIENNTGALKLVISVLFTLFLFGTAISQTIDKNDNPLNVKMTKKELLSFDNKITSLYSYYNLDINLPAVYCQVSSLSKKQDPVTFYQKNTEFTGNLLKEMQKAKDGDRFYFDKITFIGKDGNAFQLKPIVITIIG
ncbi:MAG TPA: hypothetical protein ENK91_06875 [Bacteroidetes bacterium]|nr:hypothetical protein [Bacteroidota bacterium]